MISVIIGLIKEVSHNEYVVNMLKRKIIKKFSNLDSAVKFSEKHSEGLVDTNEIQAVAVEYRREDNRASFLITEKIVSDKEKGYLKYEETAYDFYETHKALYSKYENRKMINERYYSFHDFARRRVLTPIYTTRLRIMLNIIVMISSVVFLFYGLHAVNLSNASSVAPSGERLVFSLMVSLISIVSFSIGITATISYWYPLYKIKKARMEHEEVDWRKLNRFRTRIKQFIILIALIGVVPFTYMISEFIGSDIWIAAPSGGEIEAFVMMLFGIFGLFILVSILELVNSILNNYIDKKFISKYYNQTHAMEYKAWRKYKTSDVVYKEDKTFLITNNPNNEEIVLAKINMFDQVEKTSTKEELKEYKHKVFRHYKSASKKYIEKLRNS